MEQILLEAITSQMKHITGKSQQRFTKCKLCLTKSVTFYNKVTYFVDVEQVVSTRISSRLSTALEFHT